jgi:hypothetical protein
MMAMFSPRLRMEGLGGTDGGQVAVPLVGEDDSVGEDALDARRGGAAPPVGRL